MIIIKFYYMNIVLEKKNMISIESEPGRTGVEIGWAGRARLIKKRAWTGRASANLALLWARLGLEKVARFRGLVPIC